MARHVLTPGHIDSDGLLFLAGTPIEGAMGEFIAIGDEVGDPLYPDGFSFMNDGDKRTLIAIDNRDGGGDTTLTIETYETVDGLAVADRTVLVSAGDMVLVRPGPAATYNQPDGSIYFNVSPVDGVQIAVVKVDP